MNPRLQELAGGVIAALLIVLLSPGVAIAAIIALIILAVVGVSHLWGAHDRWGRERALHLLERDIRRRRASRGGRRSASRPVVFSPPRDRRRRS